MIIILTVFLRCGTNYRRCEINYKLLDKIYINFCDNYGQIHYDVVCYANYSDYLLTKLLLYDVKKVIVIMMNCTIANNDVID